MDMIGQVIVEAFLIIVGTVGIITIVKVIIG